VAGYNIGTATATIEVDTKQGIAALRSFAKEFGGLEQQTRGLNQTLNNVAVQGLGKGLAGFGLAIAGGFGLAINSAANFEQGMSNVRAALSSTNDGAGLTKEQFKALNDEALRIGATTSASATEAASAMEVLAKAGASTETILNGGAQAAVNISEATGESLNQSAETMASVSNLFADTGITAAQIADVIVNGMGQSNASLSEFQTGIARLAPVIAATGMSFEESAAAIAYFNARGFSAAEVGTSLTSAFTRLANPTDEAAAKMGELGISAFDAQGNFVGFPSLMDQVQTATAGMSEEAKAAAISLIFGADGMDLFADAAKTGGDGLRETTDEMGVAGSAAEQAAIRMDNFRGSVEQLKGAIETLLITVGSRLLPVVREVADGASGLVTAFLGLSEGTQTVIAGAAGVAGALSLAAGGFILIAPRIQETVKAYQALRAAQLGLLGPVGLGIAAVGLFALAIHKNIFGLGDGFHAVTSTVSDIIDRFKVLNRTVSNVKGRGFTDAFGNVAVLRDAYQGLTQIERVFAVLGDAIEDVTGLPVAGFFAELGTSIQRPVDGVLKMWDALTRINAAFRDNGIRAGFDALFGSGGRKLLAGFGDTLGSLPKLLGKSLLQISTGFAPVDRAIHDIGQNLVDVGRLAQEVFSGDIRGALTVLERLLLRSFLGPIKNALRTIDELFGTNLFGGFNKLFAPIQDTIDSVFGSLGDALTGLTGRWGKSFGKMGDALKDIGKAFTKGGLRKGFDALFGKSGRKLLTGFGDTVSAIPKAFGEFLRGIETPWGSVNTLLDGTGDVLNDIGRLAQEVFAGDFAGALTVGKRLLGDTIDLGKDFVSGFLANARTAVGLLGDAIRSIDWGAIASGIGDFASDAWSAIQNGISLAWDQITDLNWDNYIDKIQDFAGLVAGKIKDLPWGDYIDKIQDFAGLVAGRVKDLPWGDYITAIEDLGAIVGGKIKDLPWADYLGTAIDLGAKVSEKIKELPWGDYVTAVTDLGALIAGKISSLPWGDYISAVEDLGTLIAAKISSLPWADYLGETVDLGAKVAEKITSLPWGDYLGEAIDLAGLVSTKIVSLPWGDYITAIEDLSSLVAAKISSLPWSDFIGKVEDLGTVLGAKILQLEWSAFVTLLEWSTYVPSLVWSDLTPSLTWRDFVPGMTWESFIIAPVWTSFIPGLSWASYISVAIWSDYVNPLDWVDWLTSLSWGDYVSNLSWGDFVPTISWTSFIPGLSWLTYLPLGFSWNDFIPGVAWTDYIPADLSWSDFVPTVTWSTFIPGNLSWDTFISALSWTSFIPAQLDWVLFISSVAWRDYIPFDVNWSGVIPNLTWSDFVPDISWGDYIPSFSWPSKDDILKALIGAVTGDGANSNELPGGIEIPDPNAPPTSTPPLTNDGASVLAGIDVQGLSNVVADLYKLGQQENLFKAVFTADYTAVDKASQVAWTLGNSWASAPPFQATFSALYDLVDRASIVSWTLGGSWAQSVHTGQFNGDPTGADRAAQTAFSLGYAWDAQVFTASFSVDVSNVLNAVAVVRQAAQDISNLLPHSPAKEGPLSRVPDFSYILDSLKRSFDPMAGVAERDLQAVQRLLDEKMSIARLNQMAAGISPNGFRSGGVINNSYYRAGDSIDARTLQQLAPEALLELLRNASRGAQAADAVDEISWSEWDSD